MTYIAEGGLSRDLSDLELDELLAQGLARAGADAAPSGPVLILPPDGTRFHSRAGYLTDLACRELGSRVGAIMPALGTHIVMTREELRKMFHKSPQDKFISHDWRNDVVELGRLEADWVAQVSENAVHYDWPVQVNKALRDGGFSLILSIGQVVPHEVVGMANHAKNIFVGTGGKEAIDKSHFVGASYGMERMMGRIDTPVRAMFDEGMRRFSPLLPPILWVLTVVSPRTDLEASGAGKPRGSLAVRGLYIGFGRECFEAAAKLAQELNVDILEEPITKAVVYLESSEFRTTWLGNKAIYRTRMALADAGELLILAPGLERFGEDYGNDRLIRKYGYRPAKVIQEKVGKEPELAGGLSAAAHLIHGSSEGRFRVRYCPGPGLSRREIESVGYEWGDLKEALARYDVDTLGLGWNTLPDGERIFYVPNPALGLWAEKKRFFTSAGG
ncbi:MAG: lactate racemase domain-containing protein [Spirochaetaceae bacterium]|jgi:nickel-dependent lactate racemase|nr:lactate racemase domain-containing protein [Spirochaetaceae bacterium]